MNNEKLAKMERTFEKVFQSETKNPTREGEVKYSVGNITDANGKSYGVGVHLDSTLLDNLTTAERKEMVKEYVKEIGGESFTAYDKNGNEVAITIAKSSAKFRNQNGKRVAATKDLVNKQSNNVVKQEAIALVDELITTAEYDKSVPSNYPHGWIDNNGKNNWEYWKTYVQDENKTIWEVTLNVANSKNGEKILYDIGPINKVGRAIKLAAIPTKNNISQNKPTVNGPKSLSKEGSSGNVEGWQIKGVDVLLQQEADKNGLVWENGVPFRKDLLKLTKQQAEEDFQIAPPTRKRCKSKYGPVKKYPQRCCNCRCWQK